MAKCIEKGCVALLVFQAGNQVIECTAQRRACYCNDVPGTTRDFIEEKLLIECAVRMVDTAGLENRRYD